MELLTQAVVGDARGKRNCCYCNAAKFVVHIQCTAAITKQEEAASAGVQSPPHASIAILSRS
jgi:hypothetical protein